MTTKEITEAILYLNPDTYKHFRAAHIINDSDRQYKPIAHPEYPFINAFKDPRFLIVISKQIHVYIIGEKSKGKRYNIINIEGFSADHMTLTKSLLTNLIKTTVSEKLFLPYSYQDRIIYMYREELFIFNRQDIKGTIFSKSEWSLGINIYDASIKTYKTNAWEILKAIYEEF